MIKRTVKLIQENGQWLARCSYTRIISHSYYNVPFVPGTERTEFREISVGISFLAGSNNRAWNKICVSDGLSGALLAEVRVHNLCRMHDRQTIDTRREFRFNSVSLAILRGPSGLLIPLVNRRLFRTTDFRLYIPSIFLPVLMNRDSYRRKLQHETRYFVKIIFLDSCV